VDLHVLDIVDSLFTGTIETDEGSLASNGSTIIKVPTKFTYAGLFNLIAALTDESKKENPMYKLDMVAHIPVPEFGDFSFPFKHEDKIPIMKFPEIDVATAPKAEITYGNSVIPGIPGIPGIPSIPGAPTGGKIDFSFNLKNASNVAVILNQLSCTLKINNIPLSLGLTDKPKINAGATEKIDFSFPLTLTDITNIGLSLLTGGISSYNFTVDSKLGIPDFPLIDKLLDYSITLNK